MIWEALMDGSYGDNSGTTVSYTPITPSKAEQESLTNSPKIMLGKYLRGKLNQNPPDTVIPESSQVCEMLVDILRFANWGVPPVIECKKRSKKKWPELQELIRKKCLIQVAKEYLPQTGYQVEYFMELFKYIKDPK